MKRAEEGEERGADCRKGAGARLGPWKGAATGGAGGFKQGREQ